MSSVEAKDSPFSYLFFEPFRRNGKEQAIEDEKEKIAMEYENVGKRESYNLIELHVLGVISLVRTFQRQPA